MVPPLLLLSLLALAVLSTRATPVNFYEPPHGKQSSTTAKPARSYQPPHSLHPKSVQCQGGPHRCGTPGKTTSAAPPRKYKTSILCIGALINCTHPHGNYRPASRPAYPSFEHQTLMHYRQPSSKPHASVPMPYQRRPANQYW